MKKLLLGAIGAASLGLALPASAADLAARPYTKAPPIAVAAYDWSGFYVGINGGGGSSHNCWDITNSIGFAVAPPVSQGCHDATGGTVGGQVGYRWQSASWVFGLEAQGNWANFRGSNSVTGFFAPNIFSDRSKIDAFGLFTGQVGYSWNNFLLYVKGGAAVTSDKYEGYTNIPLVSFVTGAVSPSGTVFDRASETRWGGVVGVGGEYAFTQNWSFAVEYDHLFMGTQAVSFTSTGFSIPAGLLFRNDNIRQDVDLITARLNYRFGGPVVAKY
jgi:outer membrane immunogenic protein